ncbi:MAG TPA: hypothetical protein VH134_13225 [Candidatus Dormibacteraeota bacterium]|nr:hypothetical protein [Candidatus Dormibacteraeota bacterium]
MVVLAGLPALPGCGSGSLSSLFVTLKSNDPGTTFKAGDTPTYTLSIVNSGPQAASGVSARVDLPDGVTYVATDTIDIDPYGVLRTLPQDPAVRSNNPSWGVWTLNAPVGQADGTVRRPHVDITFTVNVNARPGTLKLTPHVFSDSADGELVGKSADLGVGPSGHLTLSIAAVPNRVKRDDDVTYLLTVNNDGSGPSTGVDVLITLPDILAFSKTERTGGNAARSNATDPAPNAVVLDYGGWSIPPAGSAGPGRLTIVFKAHVVPSAYMGRYPVTVQITEANGTVSLVPDTAPVNIDAPPAPTPSPSPSPSPSPTARGAHRPSPSPTGR